MSKHLSELLKLTLFFSSAILTTTAKRGQDNLGWLVQAGSWLFQWEGQAFHLKIYFLLLHMVIPPNQDLPVILDLYQCNVCPYLPPQHLMQCHPFLKTPTWLLEVSAFLLLLYTISLSLCPSDLCARFCHVLFLYVLILRYNSALFFFLPIISIWRFFNGENPFYSLKSLIRAVF